MPRGQPGAGAAVTPCCHCCGWDSQELGRLLLEEVSSEPPCQRGWLCEARSCNDCPGCPRQENTAVLGPGQRGCSGRSGRPGAVGRARCWASLRCPCHWGPGWTRGCRVASRACSVCATAPFQLQGAVLGETGQRGHRSEQSSLSPGPSLQPCYRSTWTTTT